MITFLLDLMNQNTSDGEVLNVGLFMELLGLTTKENYIKDAMILLPFARSDISYACVM